MNERNRESFETLIAFVLFLGSIGLLFVVGVVCILKGLGVIPV